MPTDKIPYWDFNVPDLSNQSRDASAAVYELENYLTNKKQYNAFADKIMKSLSQGYRASLGSSKGYILLHSTGHKPANGEVDSPLIYAGYYYFLDALLRKKKG